VTTAQDQHRTKGGAEDPGYGVGRVRGATGGQGLQQLSGDGDTGNDEEADSRAARVVDRKCDDGSRAEADEQMKKEGFPLAQGEGWTKDEQRGGEESGDKEKAERAAHGQGSEIDSGRQPRTRDQS
jgi:hypothetical protein